MKDIDLNNLDFSNIGAWPIAVKGGLIVVLCIILLVAGYFLDVQGQLEDLERSRAQETKLKQEFEKKQAKAVNLDAYKKQLEEMKLSFGTMLRQLPSKTEVEDLLVDISQTGLSSGVEFQLFEPQAERQIEFYAELPIKMKMTGTFHEFGNFVSGIAALPRIVTLHNITITRGKGKSSKDGKLTMDVIAKTYRYLDENEIAQTRKAQKKKKKGRRR
ncbi:MAG: type 4a pilus biogenesis protein PilO [Candidatus Promineifilaceae bacterium]